MKITPEFKAKLTAFGEKFGIKLSAEEPSQPIKMAAEAKLKDGTSIYTPADAWADGVECYVMGADGNPSPCPDGSYELEDGKTVTVASGKVTAIADGAPAEEMTAEKLSEMLTAFDARLTALTEELAATKTKLSESETKLSAVETAKTDADKKITELSAEVTKLSAQPATRSIKVNFAKEVPAGEPQGPKPLAQIVKELREKHAN